MEAHIPKSQHTHDGLTAMYNLRADPEYWLRQNRFTRYPLCLFKLHRTNKEALGPKCQAGTPTSIYPKQGVRDVANLSWIE
jgi:hypothetical protein